MVTLGACDCVAPSAPLNVAAEAYSPSVVQVTWLPPAQPRGPLTDIVYVVSWHSFNADGSRAEGRVETGSRPRKVTSRSLQGHNDDLQHIFMSDLQPSRTYDIKVCIDDCCLWSRIICSWALYVGFDIWISYTLRLKVTFSNNINNFNESGPI